MEKEQENAMWREYDYAADWCARQGFAGDIGDPLPNYLSGWCCDAINADPEAFASRVREAAYARAMADAPDYSYA